jgi:dihydroorotate dehydrogenase
MLYSLLRRCLFRIDPERVHDFFVWFGHGLGRWSITRSVVGWWCVYRHPMLHTNVRGIKFANPVGLGAGFDKDVQLTSIIPHVGFGFMEVGAVHYQIVTCVVC